MQWQAKCNFIHRANCVGRYRVAPIVDTHLTEFPDVSGRPNEPVFVSDRALSCLE